MKNNPDMLEASLPQTHRIILGIDFFDDSAKDAIVRIGASHFMAVLAIRELPLLSVPCGGGSGWTANRTLLRSELDPNNLTLFAALERYSLTSL
jgi:hypothetical protein